MRAVMYIINSDARADFTYGLTTAPHLYSVQNTIRDYVAYFFDGYSDAASKFSPGHGSDWATTFAVATAIPLSPRQPAAITVWPSMYNQIDLAITSFMVHEVDHTRFGGHSVDSNHDAEEDGPYGTQIQWLARVVKDGVYGGRTVAEVDRNSLWNTAVSLTNNKITDPAARDRLFASFASSRTVLSVAAPEHGCVRDLDYQTYSAYRWAGYAFSTSSRSSTGAAATFEQLLACKSGQPAGALCSFWECNDPLTFGPMLTYHGGSAYQSSTEWDGDAMRAVDGNTDGNFWDGSVTYTAYGAPGGWWQANLGDQFAITSIDVFARTDCCEEMLTDYSVVLQDAEGYTVATNVNSGTATITYPTPQAAAYVSILQPPTSTYPLMLAEVRVWGYHVPYVAHVFTHPGPSTACGTFTTDQGLIAGDPPLASCDGRFLLVLHSTGDLALYSASGQLWHSNTAGPGRRLCHHARRRQLRALLAHGPSVGSWHGRARTERTLSCKTTAISWCTPPATPRYGPRTPVAIEAGKGS